MAEKGTQAAQKPSDSPGAWVAIGLVVSAVGGAALGYGTGEGESAVVIFGAAALALGGIVILFGIIAAGVRLGIRWADYERGRRGA